MATGTEPVDGRADRAVQGTIAVVTLGAFVFRAVWVIPVLAILVGLGAAVGPAGNPFHRLYAAVVAPRLPAARTTVPAAAVRAQDVLGVAVLGLATLLLLIQLGGIAWIVALAEAMVAVVAATTGVRLGVTVRDRLKRN